MLLIVLATVVLLWALIVAVVAGLCANAASGDRQLARAQTPKRQGLRLTA